MDFPLDAEKALGTLSRPTPTIWILELQNGVDNRLTDVLLDAVITPALNLVEKQWRTERAKALKDGTGKGAGALIITGCLTQDKFFSNGFDYQQVVTTPGLGFIYNHFNPIISRLLSYPIPTIAALNGHTFAAGFMLALACDYRIMTSGKGWASMNEVHFGAPFPHGAAALVQEKARNPQLIRKIVLEGHKFTPQEMLDAGLVDHLADGGSQGVLKKAMDVAEAMGANAGTGVWGLIKKEMYARTLTAISEDIRQVMPSEEDAVVMAKL